MLQEAYITSVIYVSGRIRKFKVLKVGKKGDIYTTSEIRAKTGIKEGGSVIAYVEEDKLVIKPLEPLEEKIKRVLVKISPDDVEKLSEKAQREAGVLG